jgi:hypothetical protein
LVAVGDGNGVERDFRANPLVDGRESRTASTSVAVGGDVEPHGSHGSPSIEPWAIIFVAVRTAISSMRFRRLLKFSIAELTVGRLIVCLVFFATFGAINCLAAPTADELLKRKGFTWRSEATRHLRLHFEPGTFAERRIEHLKAWQEKAFERNLKLLASRDYPHRTDIFIVESRERMRRLIGEETNGVAYASARVVCFVFSEKTNASGAHELMHVMAGNAWGVKTTPWINEGFAGYADDIWYGHKLHDLNKHLLKQNKLIPLADLLRDFRGQREMVSYPQAASFVKYLYERYGVDKIRRIWRDGSLRGVSRVTGENISTLERDWHRVLMEADDTKVKYDLASDVPVTGTRRRMFAVFGVAERDASAQITSSTPSSFELLSFSSCESRGGIRI